MADEDLIEIKESVQKENLINFLKLIKINLFYFLLYCFCWGVRILFSINIMRAKRKKLPQVIFMDLCY